MERRTFEEAFKDAFNGAETTPSEEVWTNIELELEKEAGEKMRRKLVFFKMLAAASIAFALSVAGIGYYVYDSSMQHLTGNVLADSPVENNKPSVQPDTHTIPQANTQSAVPGDNSLLHGEDEKANESASRSKDPALDRHNGAATTKQFSNDNASNSGVNTNRDLTDPGAEALPSVNAPASIVHADTEGIAERSSSSERETKTERALPVLYTFSPTWPSFEIKGEDPVVAMLRKLVEKENAYASADNKEKSSLEREKMWTTVGFAAGGFSSINRSIPQPTSTTALSANYSNAADKQSKASGVAYTLGVSFGTKVAKRWVLQGGVNYLTQSSDYIANNVVADADYQSLKAESINSIQSLPLLADAAASNIKPTVAYSVNNSLKFFSVPVQAGYLIVNRKFGLQLNAGVSTDLFLQNTISPEGGSLDKTTQGRGEDSPYRGVNFSGLMGTEISYRLGNRYRIALNPGVRYPFSSVYKSSVGIQSTPLTFDVGLRFRYIFK